MKMEWHTGDYRFAPSGGNGGDAFAEHAECMRRFLGSHGDLAMVNGPRCGKPALPESNFHLSVQRFMTKSGGARFPNDATDWVTLVPVLKMAQYKLSPN